MNGLTLTYDANGNTTNDGSNGYTWDSRNRLSSITGPVNGSFQYDALGRRVQKVVGGTTTNYLFDGMNYIEEQNATGAVAAVLSPAAATSFLLALAPRESASRSLMGWAAWWRKLTRRNPSRRVTVTTPTGRQCNRVATPETRNSIRVGRTMAPASIITELATTTPRSRGSFRRIHYAGAAVRPTITRM